jgi:hypothetical protein
MRFGACHGINGLTPHGDRPAPQHERQAFLIFVARRPADERQLRQVGR